MALSVDAAKLACQAHPDDYGVFPGTGSVKSYENDQSVARYSREWLLIEVAHIKQTGTEQHLSMCCFG
jgi:hypothetical protein